MTTVTLGVAGVPNTTITMVNDATEGENIAQSVEKGHVKDVDKAHRQAAMKRLKSDGDYVKDETKPNKRPIFKSHTDGAVIFPVTEDE